MKNKSLMNLSLVATASLAAAMSFIVIANNHTNVSLVRSQNVETRLVLNGSNIAENQCYFLNKNNNKLYLSDHFVFWQLRNQGNYVMMNNQCYSGGIFGGDHLFTAQVTTAGAGYAVFIEITKTANSYLCYFDSEGQREIYRPSVSNLSKIEITIGEGHNIPFYNPDNNYIVEEDGNKITVTVNTEKWNAKWLDDLYLFNVSGEASTTDKKMVIDEIALTYTCDDVPA